MLGAILALSLERTLVASPNTSSAVLPEPCRISNQFPASFVELNACRQTHDIFANEPVVNHLPSCFTPRCHVLVSEKAAVWWYEHPHVYEWREDACYRLVATILVAMGYYSSHLPF
jgi:hypothetical protein